MAGQTSPSRTETTDALTDQLEQLDIVDPAPGLDAQRKPDEEFQWVIEKHQTQLHLAVVTDLIKGLIYGLFAAVFGYIIGLGVGASFDISAGGMIGAGFFFIGVPVLLVITTITEAKFGTIQYAATEDRFLYYKDALTGTITISIPVDAVRDVEYSRGFVDKLVGTGDIHIEPERGYDAITVSNVTNSQTLLRAIRIQSEQ